MDLDYNTDIFAIQDGKLSKIDHQKETKHFVECYYCGNFLYCPDKSYITKIHSMHNIYICQCVTQIKDIYEEFMARS